MLNSPVSFPLRPTRLQVALWVALMLVTLSLLVYDWNSYLVGTYGDDGTYVAATDSLLRDVPFGTLLDPDNSQPTQFPFVFPALLAPWRAWFGNDLNAMRVVPLLATLGLVAALFWGWQWIGRGLSYWWGLGTAALTALSPVTILHGRTVMSEAVFLLICLLFVIWVERIVEKSPRAWGIGLGILAVALVYSRTVGWFFLAVGIGYLLWKKRRAVWKQFGIAVLTSMSLLGCVLLLTTVRPINLFPNVYIGQLTSMIERGSVAQETGAGLDATTQDTPTAAAEQTRPYWQSLVLSLENHFDLADKLPYRYEQALTDLTNRLHIPFLRYLPLVLGMLIIAAGAWFWVKRTGVTVLQLMAPVYMLVLLGWVWNGSRLIHPIQPQLFLGLLLGIYGLTLFTVKKLHWQPRWANIVTVGAVLLLLTASAWLDLQLSRTMLLPGNQYARATILQTYLPPDARVLSARAETDYLYSPQTFFAIPNTNSSDGLLDFMRRYQVQYVVTNAGVTPTAENEHLRVGKMSRMILALQPWIANRLLEEKYFDRPTDFAIYRVNPQLLARLP